MEKLNLAFVEEFTEKLRALDRKKAELDRYRPLDGYTLGKIKQGLEYEWIYNSNSIEGNSLTLAETRMVLQDGITVGGKSLREHFEAVNHQEAIEFVESLSTQGGRIAEREILQVHSLVLQKIEKEFLGQYRTTGVRIVGASFTPPNALKVPELMHDLVTWLNKNPDQLHPLVLAAVFHHRFVWIHPFVDGNGRTVRLVSNLILMNYGFPPAIILSADRKKYYRALNQADKNDFRKLILMVLQAVERSLDIYLSNAQNYAEDYKPISRIIEEAQTPYGQEYVSLLARQGKIDAYKEGKTWLTTIDALESYAKSKGR